jgi:hypothetical protein
MFVFVQMLLLLLMHALSVPQERRINELSQEVTQEKHAKEALSSVLVTFSTQKQQQADETDKNRLLSLDSLHACPPPSTPPQRLSSSSSSSSSSSNINNARAAHQHHVVAGGSRSPRRVC